MYNDTIVTLIGKPLPAKMDVFYSYTRKALAFRNLAGREGTCVHFSPRTQNLSLRYFPESGTSSLKLLQ